jgi:hypothetical protein
MSRRFQSSLVYPTGVLNGSAHDAGPLDADNTLKCRAVSRDGQVADWLPIYANIEPGRINIKRTFDP